MAAGLLPLLSPQQAKEWLDQREAIIIDVRNLTSYKALHIPNSLHVPDSTKIAQSVTEHPTERVILVCQNGGQATQISHMLLMQPTPETAGILFYVLDNGLNGWRNADLPVVRDMDLGMPIDRQVQITLGLALLVSLIFGWLFSSLWFIFVFLIALGLLLSGLTGWYGFQQLVLLFPWNRHE